jgi:hypothetical protein
MEIFAAELSDRHRCPILCPPLGGIRPPRYAGQQLTGVFTGLIWGEHAIAADGEPTTAPVLVPVLDDERLGATWLHAKPEPGQVIVPNNKIPRAGLLSVNGSLREFDH